MDLNLNDARDGKSRRRLPKGPLLGLILVLALALWAWFRWNEPRPSGQPGPAADAFANAMMDAVNHPAWLETGAVRWTFAGKHEHLWDRDRHLARVRWKEIEAFVDLTSRAGIVTKDGVRLTGKEADRLLQKAWGFWANDSFWLNPISKLFDEGTSRELVPLEEGGSGLLITYSSGGVTPGDAYLWLVGEDGLPYAWRMWVSIIPLGGVKTSWQEWITLSTGVKIATQHHTPLGPLRLTEVAGAAALAELEPGPDPFRILEGKD